MDNVGSELVNKVSQIEEVGRTIVGTQESIVQMDHQRAKLKEALHAINSNRYQEPSKVYTAVCPDLFIQYPSDFLKKVLKDDVNTLDSSIEEHRGELRQNVDKLLKLEGDKDLAELGFDLKSCMEEKIDI